MKKKSILFILPNLELGGAERITTIILNNIDLNTFAPTLLLMEKKGGYLEILKPEIPIVELKVKRIRNSIFKILTQIRKLNPDLVFSSYGEVNAFISPFIPLYRNTKFIARETNVVSKHITRKEILFFYKFYNNFNCIIAQSNDMELDLINNFKIKQNKITKINNPIDFELINQKLSNQSKPAEFKLDKTNILAVGNLSYRKGYDNIIKTFNYIKDKAIHLFIIGEGPNELEFKSMVKKLEIDNISFLGKKNNPFPYMKYADLFILGSRYEGFPNALVEANACGTYALANNCLGGINEIILDKINGEIIEIKDHKEAAKKILEVINVDFNKSNISESVKKRFSKEIILSKYFTLFNTI